MKKLIILAAITILVSCDHQRGCYECEIQTGIQVSNFAGPTTTSKIELCDLTEKEIREYEKANNTVTPINVDNFNAGIMWLKCKCNKK